MSTLLAINNYYFYRGGAETVFMEHNRLLAAQGWKVIPFAMKHPKNLATPWSEYFVEEIEFGAQYSIPARIRRAQKVIYSLEARRNLGRLLDRVSPDVCHAHNIYHHISPSILGLLKRREIPTVLTLHDLKIACPAYNMLTHDGICERCRTGVHNVLLHRCIKGSMALSAVVMVEAILHRALRSYVGCVSRFVVPSRFYIEKFCQWGFERSLFHYVPNFVDVERYKPRYAPGKSYVYCGRISREKGLATLIRAAVAVGSRLLVAGIGPELEAARTLSAQLKANVTFLGFLSGDALHEVVRGARAVVLPSEWYENAPLSLLEAYALGKPIIGARIGGIPELVREDETGLAFDSGDEVSLAAALSSMTERKDPEVEEMGRCARRWVEGEFAAPLYRDRILGIYRELGVEIPIDVAAPLSA